MPTGKVLEDCYYVPNFVLNIISISMLDNLGFRIVFSKGVCLIRGTPEHNGVSERRNQILLDMARSMIGFTDLPINLWGYALEATNYLLNKVPTISTNGLDELVLEDLMKIHETIALKYVGTVFKLMKM